MTAINGPANGMTSTDVGISEPGNTIGHSIQLEGTGIEFQHFNWSAEAPHTRGQPNGAQIFQAPSSVNEWSLY